MSKKENAPIYSKPNKLMAFVENVDVLERNVERLDDKLFHLQNKINATVAVSREGINESPQFQSLLAKKERLEEQRAVEKEFVEKTLNAMLSNFKATKIEDSQDVRDILKCVEYALTRARSEVDKGAILSNIFSLHVVPAVEPMLLTGIDDFVEYDKELLTGYLIYNEEQPESAFNYSVSGEGLDKLFKNSIVNRGISASSCEVSKIILEDEGYIEKFFDRLGDKTRDVIANKDLNKKERAFLKSQYNKYRVQRKTSPKAGSKMLKVSAALPSAVGKVVYGSLHAVGTVFSWINKAFEGVGLVLASPFICVSRGLKKMSINANKNKTYAQDYADIYKNLRKVLKKNGVKVRDVKDVKASVEQVSGASVLNLSGTVVGKDRVPFNFNALYQIKEGEFKNILMTMKENVVDENELGHDPEKLDFTLGEYKNKPEVIRLMRKLAEITDDGVLCLNLHKVPQELVKVDTADEDVEYLDEVDVEEGDKQN